MIGEGTYIFYREEELRRRKLLGKKMRFFCRGEEKGRRIWREIFEPKQDKRTTD